MGILLDLGSETDVREVRPAARRTGLRRGAAGRAAGVGGADRAEGLEEVDAATGVGGEVTLTADEAVTTRYLVVWLTALPDVGGGFRGKVAEIDVRS